MVPLSIRDALYEQVREIVNRTMHRYLVWLRMALVRLKIFQILRGHIF